MILRCKALLGTFVKIQINHESSIGYNAVCEAFDEIDEIHNLMSFFSDRSQINLLNNSAHQTAIKVDLRLFEVLSIAQKLSDLSDGVFDITLHRSTKENAASFRDIKLFDDCMVKFDKPLCIDLGGIAKGYAVDCAAKILQDYDITDYVINAGGDLRVGQTTQKVDIRNPKYPTLPICEAEICDGSIATSSGYFSYQEISQNGKSQKIYPIFQSCASPLQYRDESVSVFSKNCVNADALTKVVAVLQEKSANILSALDARAMFVDHFNNMKFIN